VGHDDGAIFIKESQRKKKEFKQDCTLEEKEAKRGKELRINVIHPKTLERTINQRKDFPCPAPVTIAIRSYPHHPI